MIQNAPARNVIFALSGLLFCLSTAPSDAVATTFKAFDVDSGSGQFPILVDINPRSGLGAIPPEFADCPAGAREPNVVFVVGFTSGYAYRDGVLYGIEWEGGDDSPIFLYTMADSFCATGTRVVAQPVGFTNLESLVYRPEDDAFYSVDFDFPGHVGRLIRIDPNTGVGTVVGGTMARDVRITGMSYDAATDTFLAITGGFGVRNPELVRVNPITGADTIIGPTGTAPGSLESLELDTGTFPASKLYAAGTEFYEIDILTGAATMIGAGNYQGTLWALAGLPGTTTFSSVLPGSRAVQVGSFATLFASISNAGADTASGCRIAPLTPVAADFAYQTTDSANTLVGSPNTPVNIAGGAIQNFVLSFTPTAAFSPSLIEFDYNCANSVAPYFKGLNDFLLTATEDPGPDVIALVASQLPGIVEIPMPNFGFFAVATANIGTEATLSISTDTGDTTLPVTILLCQTDAGGDCSNPIAPTPNPVSVSIAAGGTPTFAVFVSASEAVPFDPANNRVYFRVRNAANQIIGSTSVAIQTVP